MKNGKRALAALLSALLTVGSLTACSSANKSTASENSSAATSTGEQSKSEGKKIKLSFMSIWLPDSESADSQAKYEQINKFLKEHPNVELENNSIAHDDFVLKIKALIAANELPDIWSARGDMIPPAVDNDLIYDSDTILSQVNGWKQNFSDDAFADFRYGEKTWAIPAQMQGNSFLFCNTALLSKCGVTKAPETWDELLDAIAKVKAKGLIPLAQGNKNKSVIGDCIMSWLTNRYTGTDWFYNMKERKGARFTNPDFVKSLTALKQLTDAGAFNSDANSIDEDMGRAYYANGKSPMFFSGAWSAAWIEQNCPPEIIKATKIMAPPTIKDSKGKSNAVSGGAGWSWAISNQLKGDDLKAAAELVNSITNEEYTKVSLSKGYSLYPGITPSSADMSKLGPITSQYMNILKSVTFCPDYFVLMEPTPLETFGNVVQEITMGTITPEAGAKKIDDAYAQSVLKK